MTEGLICGTQDASRLAALIDTGLLDTSAEEAFDRITRLASRVLNAPVALFSLVSNDRQFFKSAVGLPEPWATRRETPLTHSFCQHTVDTGQPLVVRDAREHATLKDNLAVRDLNVIAYMGAPIVDKNGFGLGALCVIDGKPRDWSDEDLAILREFAALIVSEVQTRQGAAKQLRTLQELRDTEAKFKTFMDHSPAMAYIKDEAGRMLYVNKTASRYYADAESWIGKNNEELWPPEVAAMLRAHDLAAIEQDGGTDFEEVVPTAEGARLHWRTFKFPLRLVDGRTLLAGLSINIDEQKRVNAALESAQARLHATNEHLELRVRERTADLELAMESLRASESEFRFMADAMPQIVWTSKPDGNLDYYNRRWLDYTGMTFDQTKDWGWKPVLHPDDLDMCVQRWTQAVNSGEPYEIEYRFKRASDGAYRWHLGRAIPMRDSSGSITRWFGTGTDIDDQKRARDELSARVEERTSELVLAKQVAESANEAKSRFLAHMSHEIRTPLTSIFGYADLLLMPGSDDAARRDCVHTIRRNGEHLLAMINDILDLAKIEAGQMSVEKMATSLDAVLGDLLPMMKQRASAKGLSLDLRFVNAVPDTFESDPTRLRQILWNLIGNAIKFTERGEVTLQVRYDADGADVPRLAIAVRDTGVGMTADEASRMFKPFMQADASHARLYGGSGLGLSISKQLASLLGGDIKLCTKKGVGSTFTLTLPVKGAAGAKHVSSLNTGSRLISDEHHSLPTPSCKGLVLLAEDSTDNQRLISAYLEHAGAQVRVVTTGKAALESALEAREGGKPFDLILMDCQMPEMDGFTATRLLRQQGYELPIVALTANAMNHEREDCFAAGCDDFLAKPLELESFYGVVERYLGERKSVAAP